MKLMVNILYIVTVAIIWLAAASISFIGLLFASRPIFGGNTGGQAEVIQMLSVFCVVFVLTIAAILWLVKAKRRLEAKVVLVTGIVTGGFFLLVMAGFGAFQYL